MTWPSWVRCGSHYGVLRCGRIRGHMRYHRVKYPIPGFPKARQRWENANRYCGPRMWT